MESRMTALTIGQVADAADVNIQTIRYYERRGLFPTPRRTPAGYRQYADDAVARLRCRRAENQTEDRSRPTEDPRSPAHEAHAEAAGRGVHGSTPDGRLPDPGGFGRS